MKQKDNKKNEKSNVPMKPVTIWSVIRPVLQLGILLFFAWIALQDPTSADDLITGPLPFFGWLIMCGVVIFRFPVWARWVLGIGGFCLLIVCNEMFAYYFLKYSTYGASADYVIFLFLGYGILLVSIRLVVALIQYFRYRGSRCTQSTP